LACAAPPSTHNDELIKVEHDWAEAIVKADTAALARLYANEYTNIEDGALLTKTQDIQAIGSGNFKMSAYAYENLTVRMYGNMAVVTGRNTITAAYLGKPAGGVFVFTDVFVKRDGRWQCVATHSSPAAKE
jgi:ketosteroid isomerase-like protein